MNEHGHDFGHEFVSESVSKICMDFGHGLGHGLGQSHDFGHGHVRKPRTRTNFGHACPLIFESKPLEPVIEIKYRGYYIGFDFIRYESYHMCHMILGLILKQI